MAPSRRKGSRAAASAAAAARQQWKIGDLVLAKMKGFPAWPAEVTEPEKWGYTTSDRKKVLVYFYGTKQIAFCNYADIEAFTEEKMKSLLVKRQGKGVDFVRAVNEIIDIYEKKQSLTEVISSDKESKPNNEDSIGSRSKSSTNNIEINSHENNNHQLETLSISIENHDLVNQHEIPRTSLGGDPHNRSISYNGPMEKVSILDQLRQTPLSTTTSTRKRQRDGSLQSSVIQRAPSLRRSRSSSSGDIYKYQKSSMKGNEADQAGGDMSSNPSPEEYSLKKVLSGHVDNATLCCNGDLPSNDRSDDIGSDRSIVRSDAEEASMLESSCKLVKCGNGHLDKNQESNEAIVNGKLDRPVKAGILKKKRKPNPKRATNTPECGTLEKEADMQVELHESLPESPKYQKEMVETFSKADGDEHLPLVKRARVRMGKPLTVEKQLDEFVERGEKLELIESLEESESCIKPSSSVSSPADRTLLRVIQEASSSLVNDCAVTAGRDPMLWKVNRFQMRGITLDGEAVLPPSKRLHRALEAMSANAAKEADDTPIAPSNIKIISSSCTDFTKANPNHQPIDENVGSRMRSHHFQPVNAAFHNNKLEFSSSLASQDQEEPIASLPKVDPDKILRPSLRSPQKKETGKVLPGSNSNGVYTSNMSDLNIKEEVLQPCDLKLVEKLKSVSSEGITDWSSLPLGVEIKHEDENEALPSTKESVSQEKDLMGSGSMKLEPIEQKPDSLTDSNIVSNSHGNLIAAISMVNVASAVSNTSGSAKSPNSMSDETVQDRDMSDVAREAKHKITPKDWGSSDWTPIKDLIAAAQAKCLLSRSTSFPDSIVDGKVLADPVVSPSVTNKGDSSVYMSPQTSVIHRRPATDDRTHNIQNGSRSQFVGQRERGSNKIAASMEANVARRSFEALLCTLSRTKDSIGRATRVAVDCAKSGIAGEVVEILLHHLERESSLYKRVDLFFLVDSITQYSRSQNGGVGDVYLSLVQSVLPRLLSAAAPHGHTAWENRKQCLKVLRLWLERKTLPESIVRHHIRELESASETLASSYSRRPSRAERSLNDPIREMEGMFVDEYGSNTSFHLQHFIHPPLLEDDEGSADDEKSFEAVTPERNAEVEDDKEMAQTLSEKHRHILEDVDGELEMEDVAPPCGVEASFSCHVSGIATVPDAHYQHKQHQTLPCAPPLPQDLPPSPPPLPSSPPPMAPSCSASISLVSQQQSGGSHTNNSSNNFHLSNICDNQHQQQQSSRQQNNFQGNLISSESATYYTQAYDGFPTQMPPTPCPHGSSGYFNSHTVIHSGNNFQPNITTTLPNKAYTLQPPPPSVSNQFSYVQAESQPRSQSWGNCASFGDRFQYAHGPQGGNFCSDRSIRGPPQNENVERGRFPSAINSGSIVSDRADKLFSPHSRYGPNSESSSNPSHGWSIPPRISSYPASKSTVENGFSRVTEAPSYWRPR